MDLQLMRPLLEAALAELTDGVGAAGLLDGAKVVLFVNTPALGPDTLYSDLTIATFTGYAASTAIVWVAPGDSSETQLPVVYGDAKTFTCSGDPLDNTVTGYAIVDKSVAPVLLAAALLATPEVIGDGSFLVLLPRVGISDVGKIPSGALAVT